MFIPQKSTSPFAISRNSPRGVIRVRDFSSRKLTGDLVSVNSAASSFSFENVGKYLDGFEKGSKVTLRFLSWSAIPALKRGRFRKARQRELPGFFVVSALRRGVFKRLGRNVSARRPSASGIDRRRLAAFDDASDRRLDWMIFM